MDVSENRGTPKSFILIGFSIINHPFWGTPIVGNTHIDLSIEIKSVILIFPSDPTCPIPSVFLNQQKWQHSAAPLRKPGVLVIHRKRPKRSTFFPSDVPRSLLEDASKFNGDPNFTDSCRLVATNAKENGQGSKETVVFSVEQVNS